MSIQTIDASARINGTRVYGTLVWNAASCAAAKGHLPRYEGDTEQCDDCGHDHYSVGCHYSASAGFALVCDKCGATYELRSEE